MRAYVVALCIMALSATALQEAAEVSELTEGEPTMTNGGDTTHVASANGGEGFGYWKSDNNFPGPKYGLPGYKESHNWETDVDSSSPLVFDHHMYQALINVKPSAAALMSESALRVHFNKAVNDNKAPFCPQGNVWFNANKYYEMHKKKPEFSMGGSSRSLIFKVYITQGVFQGWETSRHVVSNDKFAPIGSKLFNPTGGSKKGSSNALFQVKAGQYFDTPAPGFGRTDNTFSPARHMTLVFWMQVAAQAKAPNAELFAYGGAQSDNYFRTGFGCIAASIADKATNCYFITVFQAGATKEYFHTYNKDNFGLIRAAFGGQKWAHVVYMLTTASPGFEGDGVKGCPSNGVSPESGAASSSCNGALFLYVNKAAVKLVDWNDGTSTKYAPKWKGPVTGSNMNPDPVWKNPKPKGDNGVFRRFWVSPPNNVAASGITNNELKWDFPWTASYAGGIYFCDFTAIPSGQGGFGVSERRVIAMSAFFQQMSKTRSTNCQYQGVANIGPPGSAPKFKGTRL